MSAQLGWLLAAACVAVGYWSYGWPGVVLAFTVVVFWLLLQFSQALKVMRKAGARPIGQVDSAVMLHAKLRAGLRLMEVIKLTRSLGTPLAQDPETWGWTDASGAQVQIVFQGGQLQRWELLRPQASDNSVT